MTQPIPQPPGLPFLGNILDLRHEEAPLSALNQLADIYGPTFQLNLLGKKIIYCSSVEMMEELCDESKFIKEPPGAFTGKPAGLFTAQSDDPDWSQAHNILMPAFGPLAIERMFDEMQDIAKQLVLKWARRGPEYRIHVTDDFTRLTLDTIALCAMDYRFNSFYQDQMHPFVDAMLGVLLESGNRFMRPAIVTRFMSKSNAKFDSDQEFMRKLSGELVDHRLQNPTDKKDLLNAMISGVDSKTGQTLRADLIIANMITFLIAGHETTSGLLSFAFLNLMKSPSAYRAAQKEVDDVVGDNMLGLHHLKKLKYIAAVLRETSRLYPTAPIIGKIPNPKRSNEISTLAGKFVIEPGTTVKILLGKLHRDVHVYGEDACDFKPERMLDENFDKLPSCAWKPFGNGVRACIGRGFAWQEALIVTAMLLQTFDFYLDDPAYQLRIKQTLTIKPTGLYMRAKLRRGGDVTRLEQSLSLRSALPDQVAIGGAALTEGQRFSVASQRMTILYGSNTGTSQAFAQKMALEATMRGIKPTVKEMDDACGDIQKNDRVVIITASYEGQPPSNAARFVDWLKSLEGNSLEDSEFAVFGCGHSDWSATFQRIPKMVDDIMSARGSRRMAPRGLSDAAKGNMFGDFEEWMDDLFWPNTTKVLTDQPQQNMLGSGSKRFEISTQARSTTLRSDVSQGLVLSTKRLTKDGEPQKWHMDIQLPSEAEYQCGDYLAILPMNSHDSVRRVMARFALPWDASIMSIVEEQASTIPAKTPLSVYEVLRGYVELFQPATKKDLKTCAHYAVDADQRAKLLSIAADTTAFELSILAKRISVFELLEQDKSIALPFGDFISMLPPMRVRQYSISSSPLKMPQLCSITFSVINEESLSGSGHFAGVAGTYLSGLQAGDRIQVSVRQTQKVGFRLPLDTANTPIMMFCAGTGLAPFRGFIQQRAIQHNANPKMQLARALLFVGCRSESADRLYPDEMDEWVKQGVVDIRYAFSKEAQNSQACAHVSDRMLKDSLEIFDMWDQGSRVYVCGSRQFAESVRQTATELAMQRQHEKTGAEEETNDAKLHAWHQKIMEERVATDVFE